jgi:UDP-N-acetylmuramyl pentapeptide synthase
MNELGKKSLEFHKKILKLTLKQSFDYCIFVGTNFYSIKNLTIKSNVKFMNNVDELIEKIDTFINNRCSIFIKGSNSINLSKIVRHLI